jgi:DNA-binding transcriptional regulator YhcF (GntR family)
MSQPVPQNEPAGIPRDTYPIVRISGEFFLRGIDLLTRVQNDKLISGLIFMTLWHSLMTTTERGPVGVRELARKLNLPYETVRRHAAELVGADQCVATREGIAVRSAVLRSRSSVDVLRKIYLNAERMLLALTRVGLAKFRPPRARAPSQGALTREQTAIATVATGQLLAGARYLGDLWGGDLLRGLVFTAIWTANVKHVTNTAPAASQAVLSDDQRLPVSILAISNSLRLPYETVRRHANALEKDGICVRVGRLGLVVPASTHRRFSAGAVETRRLVADLLTELRRTGVKV